MSIPTISSYIPTTENTIPKILEACKARLAVARAASEGYTTSTTETIINKATLHFEKREINNAVNTLCAHLESTNKYNPVLEVALMFLIDIAIFSDRISKLQKPFLTFQKVSSHEKSPRFEFILHHIISRLEALMSLGTASTQEVSSDDAFIAAILPESSSAIKVGVASATPVVFAFVQLFFRKYRYTFGTNFQATYLSTMSKVLSFIVKHNLGNLIGGLSNSLRDFAKDIFSRTDIAAFNTLESAVKNSSGLILNLRLAILEAAVKLSQWSVVKFSLEEINTVTRLVDEAVRRCNHHNKNSNLVAKHVHDVELAQRRFAVIADVFLKCENWVFHADALTSLSIFAPAELQPAVATKILIAALSAPSETDAVKPSTGNFFEDQDPSMRIATMLGLPRVPSRASAVAAASEKLANADANAQALFTAVTEGKTLDIAVIYKHLAALKQSAVFAQIEAADADRYLAALERALLLYFMENHFHSTSVLDFTTFDKVKVLFPKKNDLVSLSTTLSARVDMRGSSASFGTAEYKVRNYVSAIGAKASAIFAAAPAKAKRTLRISAVQLEKETTRLTQRIDLAKKCVDKAADRKKNLEKKEHDEVRERREAIEREERERHEKLRAANFERMKKKVQNAENIERRKKVLEIVAKRNPGVHFVPKITEDGRNFLDRSSAVLAQYRREVEEKRTISLREAHYLEKYIRDVERPKREEAERNMADQYKKDSEARIENFKAQHRRNFESQLALKARLDLFRSRAAAYEAAALEAAAASVKVSKRDEQQDLLEAEKERMRREHQ